MISNRKKDHTIVDRFLSKLKRKKAVHSTPYQRKLLSERIDEINHPTNPSKLHNLSYNKWLRSRYPDSASVDYIYKPEEINKRLALKSIFSKFDLDRNGKLELHEFTTMFIQTYISELYKERKAHSNPFFHHNEDEYQPTNSPKVENRRFSVNLMKIHLLEIERYFNNKFLRYYRFITRSNYLTLEDFISLSVDEKAGNYFKSIMRGVRKLLENLQIEPLKVIPLEFDTMVDFLGYVSTRDCKITKYLEELKSGNNIKAFEYLADAISINPKIHTIVDSFRTKKNTSGIDKLSAYSTAGVIKPSPKRIKPFCKKSTMKDFNSHFIVEGISGFKTPSDFGGVNHMRHIEALRSIDDVGRTPSPSISRTPKILPIYKLTRKSKLDVGRITEDDIIYGYEGRKRGILKRFISSDDIQASRLRLDRRFNKKYLANINLTKKNQKIHSKQLVQILHQLGPFSKAKFKETALSPERFEKYGYLQS